MTNSSLKSISPDGITGAVFALEGIRNSLTLLNGPMGCKFYHSTTSQFLLPRPALQLPVTEGEKPREVSENYLNDWFFRQSRVPCTYLDSHDYVYGTADKVREALLYIRAHIGCDFVSVVNAPGASLIGDDPRELCSEIFPATPTAVIESPGFSTSFWEGTDEAILALLKQAGPKLWGASRSGRKHDRPVVNIVGLSVWQKYAEGNRNEIVRLLERCGIEVGCVLCAGCSLEELRRIPEADLNLVLYPELGRQSAAWLHAELGMPAYICAAPPIGFDAAEKLLRELCAILGTDAAPVLPELEKARALCWYKINGVYNISGRPNGTLFAVRSLPSEETALSDFLTDYMGMIRDTGDIAETKAEEVFADANIIGELMLKKREFCGIEIANPTMGYVDVTEKCTLGIRGAMFLTEQVLNGFMTRSV
ncbi:MAG: oxidoreductase [Clostridiales bacterium]|nr:oxidoreductase [Candidatus Apopatocola equi]